MTHCKSNLRLLSVGFVPLTQSANNTELVLCCGPLYQRGGYIQKPTNRPKKALYNYILQHSQVVVSPIVNNSLKLSIDRKVEKQLVPKFLLRILLRELHNSMIIQPEESRLKEERDAENNIIISDSTLLNILLT